jgi:hypothetical protein
MLIAALLIAFFPTARAVAPDSLCRVVQLEAEDGEFGGQRLDGAEHIRGLHESGAAVGTPVALPAAGGSRRVYLWLLDTTRDGVEVHDVIAMTLRPVPSGDADEFVPLLHGSWDRRKLPPVRLCTEQSPMFVHALWTHGGRGRRR